MLTLFDFDESPNCLKTKILLNELAIPFHREQVTRARLRGPDYRAQFPTGHSPAIQDGELSLAESGAIALYLASKHQRFVPESPTRRALMYQAMLMEASLLTPTVGGQGLFGELYKPEAERNLGRIGELREKAARIGQVLSQILGDKPYFAEELSIADFQLYPATSKSLAAGVFGEAPPNLVDWCARMTARPAVQSAREDYVHYRGQSAA